MAEYVSFKVGCSAIVIRDGKVLLGKRKGRPSSDGTWGLPGGHLEHGEKVAEAALRELEEETGMTATQARFVNVVNDIRPNTDDHRIQIAFFIEDAVGEPTNLEPEHCYGWEWHPLDALPENIFAPFAKQLKAFREEQVFVDGSNLS